MSRTTHRLAGASRRLTLGLLPAMLAALLVPLQASATLNTYDGINEYTTLLSTPFDIVTGPDHMMWFTAAGSDAIVKVDPSTGNVLNTYSWPGCGPTGITIGPDQNLWVACFNNDQILKVTTAGAITPHSLPVTDRSTAAGGNSPEFLTSGPDGFLWFTVVNAGYVAKMNVSTGSLYEYPLAAGPCLATGTCAGPRGIAVGPDGNIWFTEAGANLIGRITTSGAITEYPVPTANSEPFGITVGPDGNLYFTEIGNNSIGRATLAGSITEFTIPSAASGPRMITVGPDGNLWFSEREASKIGSMTPDGGFHDVATITSTSKPFGVASGPDGNLWFAEEIGNFGKVGTRHTALTLDKTAVGFGHVLAGATAPSQRVTLTNTGPNSVSFINAQLSSGLGGPSGQFGIVGNTCTVPVVSGGTCFVDVNFIATLVPGNEAGVSLQFQTSTAGTFLAPDKQTLTVPLSATVVSAACASVAISTDLTSPQNVGATVTLTGTSAGCPNANPLYRFYLRSPEGVWSVVRDFTTANTFVWNTTGYERGTYLTGVWVKDANSTNTYDAYAFGTFTLQLPSCSSTNLASDVASPQAVGVTVNFTATSIGCPAPQYQWWVRDTAGNWSIVPGHDFAHSSTTFAWNTSTLTEGTYQIGVWAKQVGSVAAYDAFAFVTYTLTVGGGVHCSVPTLTPSVASPQPTGSSITFTAAATGCATPQFRFYIRDLAGTWHIVQDFSATNTYMWTSSSLPVNTGTKGTYLVGIWAKSVGSVNSYDDFYFLTYTLTSGTACTVNIAASPGTGAPANTPVTWTATAANCGAGAKYRFWVNPPGGSFGIVQDYSTSNLYHWTQSVPGTYQVGVWVQQAGSTAAYDNFAFTTFSLTPTSPAQVCGSVGVTPDVASPRTVGTTVTFTAAANGCSSPQYQWWVRDTAANWAIVKDFAHSSPTLAWNTSGLLPGTYLVGVWARQTGSSASYEAYSFITYTLTVPATQVCSSVGISPSVASPQPPGTTVTFTATALGCGTPNYRFFIAPPGGAFGEVQPFGPGNTLVWNTTGLAPGPYQVGVWARQSGSTAGYEAFAFITFQLQVAAGNPCATLALFPTNGSLVNTIASQPPQPVGTSITWSASATGCATAEYQFYVQAPWSSFFVVQPYSATATATWNTSGLPRGTYRVLVLARLTGSASAFDVFAVSNYEIV